MGATTLLILTDPSLAPAPSVNILPVVVQASTVEELAAAAQQALDEVAQRNVDILAQLGSDFVLSLSDASFAGGGDGHTFVLTMIFVPNSTNGTQAMLAFTSNNAITSLAPEWLHWEFALASEKGELAKQYAPMTQRVLDAEQAQHEESVVIYSLLGGAAKGTRFMVAWCSVTGQPA